MSLPNERIVSHSAPNHFYNSSIDHNIIPSTTIMQMIDDDNSEIKLFVGAELFVVEEQCRVSD